MLAYGAHHSTETAVLTVLSDILTAVGNGDLAMLALLDLSAAFDSVNQRTLLRRLEISGDVFTASYSKSKYLCVTCTTLLTLFAEDKSTTLWLSLRSHGRLFLGPLCFSDLLILKGIIS